jgi:hypothetical protein
MAFYGGLSRFLEKISLVWVTKQDFENTNLHIKHGGNQELPGFGTGGQSPGRAKDG